MNIVCRKTKCKYNNNLICKSEKIFIDRELNCTKYTPIEKDSLQDISKNMLEIAPEIAPFRHVKDIVIRCNADCIFNKDCECYANGIFINGQTEKANNKVNSNLANSREYKDKTGSSNKSVVGEERKLLKRGKFGDEKEFKLCMSKKLNNREIEKMCVLNEFENENFLLKDFENEENATKGEAKCFTFASK